MSNFAVEHVNHVRSVGQSGNGPVPSGTATCITHSWIRRLDDYALGPVPGAGAALPTCAKKEPDPASTPSASLNMLESAERRALLQALPRHEWNLSSVSRKLEIRRDTLYRKLQRPNIRSPEKSPVH